MVTIAANTGVVTLTGQATGSRGGGAANGDPHWGDISFLVGYDFGVADEGPRQIAVTDVDTPTRAPPAVGRAAGAYNQISSTDYRNWVPADRRLRGAMPGKFYWEFVANPSGPATFNGYHGVVSQQQLEDPIRTYDRDENPISYGSLVYRGNGDVWGNGSTSVTGPDAYGAGDVVMIAFEPSTGGFWVGLNGVWHDDPTADPPTRTSDDVGGDFWPVMQAREPGEGGTLRSTTSQFSYAVPAGCEALGAELGYPDLLIGFIGNDFSNTFDFDFPEAGPHIVVVAGQAGSSGSREPIVVNSVGALDVIDIGAVNNSTYESIAFVYVDVPAAGVQTVTFSPASGGVLYRAVVSAWKVVTRAVVATVVAHEGDTDKDVTAIAGESMLAISLGRGALDGASLDGLPLVYIPPTNIDGDFYHMASYAEDLTAGVITFERGATGNPSRSLLGVLRIPTPSTPGPSLEGTYSTTLVNGGAETGDLTGWTGNIEVTTSQTGGTPRTGTYFFYGGTRSTASMYQDVAIDPTEVSAVDVGGRSLSLTWWQSSGFGSDGAEMIVTFYDSFGTPIDRKKSGFKVPGADLGWVEYTLFAAVPEHTRRVRVQMDMTLIGGSLINAYVDDISLEYNSEMLASVNAAVANVVLGAVPDQATISYAGVRVILGATTDLTVKRNSTFVIVEP